MRALFWATAWARKGKFIRNEVPNKNFYIVYPENKGGQKTYESDGWYLRQLFLWLWQRLFRLYTHFVYPDCNHWLLLSMLLKRRCFSDEYEQYICDYFGFIYPSGHRRLRRMVRKLWLWLLIRRHGFRRAKETLPIFFIS